MRAGRLRPILIPLRQETTGDGYGSKRAEWRELPVVYAERTRHTASERVEHGELFTDYRAEYKLRIHAPVEEKMRVRDLTTNTLYNVVAVFPEPGLDMKRISCERVNT